MCKFKNMRVKKDIPALIRVDDRLTDRVKKGQKSDPHEVDRSEKWCGFDR